MFLLSAVPSVCFATPNIRPVVFSATRVAFPAPRTAKESGRNKLYLLDPRTEHISLLLQSKLNLYSPHFITPNTVIYCAVGDKTHRSYILEVNIHSHRAKRLMVLPKFKQLPDEERGDDSTDYLFVRPFDGGRYVLVHNLATSTHDYKQYIGTASDDDDGTAIVFKDGKRYFACNHARDVIVDPKIGRVLYIPSDDNILKVFENGIVKTFSFGFSKQTIFKNITFGQDGKLLLLYDMVKKDESADPDLHGDYFSNLFLMVLDPRTYKVINTFALRSDGYAAGNNDGSDMAYMTQFYLDPNTHKIVFEDGSFTTGGIDIVSFYLTQNGMSNLKDLCLGSYIGVGRGSANLSLKYKWVGDYRRNGLPIGCIVRSKSLRGKERQMTPDTYNVYDADQWDGE